MYRTKTTIHVVCIFSQDGSKNGASLFDQQNPCSYCEAAASDRFAAEVHSHICSLFQLIEPICSCTKAGKRLADVDHQENLQ